MRFGAGGDRLRTRFDQLRAAGIVERNHGVYQASHIALYSTYRLPAPRDPRTAKQPGRITAIDPDSH